jgi:outer membrane protein TolC
MAVLSVGLLAALLSGCSQQCFVTECDLNHYRNIMPAGLENDPTATIQPSIPGIAAPPTVLDPEREPRHLSLGEAIAMALENGTIGSPALNGTTNTSLASLNGRSVFAPETTIRVFALDPAIAGADIEASLAKFDAQWVNTMTWTTTDRPVQSAFDVFSSAGLKNISTNDAQLQSSLLKPLPTGGVAGMTFTVAYENTNLPAAVNPSYRPTLQFQFEQPLLQGFGVEINELRATHPGSILTPFPTGGRVEGVVITRLRFDESRAEFERQVHILLVNVEVAYWNLYGAYYNLYSREQALRQAFEAWKINQERYDAGKIPIQDLAQTRGQYELFRAQRIAALTQVLDDERALRAFIGLPMEDGTRLIPTDTPTLTPYQPDWHTALNEAMTLRPELVLARDDVKFRQLDLILQKNLLVPDLRFFSTYDLNGLGTHLDGGPSDPNNALASMAKDHFNDWELGLRLSMPLGFRDAHSAVRAARLQLARSYGVLQDQESKAVQFLSLEYSNMTSFYQTIIAQRAQREAAAIQLGARFKEFLAGKGTLDFLLEAQRVWADALRDEYTAVVQYNNSLAAFEFAKGTIMQHDNVLIAEGGLPHCAQVRAVEHERERTKALVLRERAKPIINPISHVGGTSVVGLPDLPENSAAPVPALLENEKQLPKLPEELPVPRPSPSQGEQGSEVGGQQSGAAASLALPVPAASVPSTPATAGPNIVPAPLPDSLPSETSASPR